jgi:2-iminobutanoate/2-iminopropanoate deaminase
VNHQVVHAPDAPDDTGINAGTFSQACRVGNTVYIGGTLAIDQHAQTVDVDDDPHTAIRRAYANLQLVCRAAGAELDDIVMLTALLTDLDHLDALNDVQAEFFSAPHPPRSTLQVAGLPHGPVELTAVAVVDRRE